MSMNWRKGRGNEWCLSKSLGHSLTRNRRGYGGGAMGTKELSMLLAYLLPTPTPHVYTHPLRFSMSLWSFSSRFFPVSQYFIIPSLMPPSCVVSIFWESVLSLPLLVVCVCCLLCAFALSSLLSLSLLCSLSLSVVFAVFFLFSLYLTCSLRWSYQPSP